MQKRWWSVRTMKFLGLLATALLFVASTGLVARAEVKTVCRVPKAYRATSAFHFKQVPVALGRRRGDEGRIHYRRWPSRSPLRRLGPAARRQTARPTATIRRRTSSSTPARRADGW